LLDFPGIVANKPRLQRRKNDSTPNGSKNHFQ